MLVLPHGVNIDEDTIDQTSELQEWDGLTVPIDGDGWVMLDFEISVVIRNLDKEFKTYHSADIRAFFNLNTGKVILTVPLCYQMEWNMFVINGEELSADEFLGGTRRRGQRLTTMIKSTPNQTLGGLWGVLSYISIRRRYFDMGQNSISTVSTKILAAQKRNLVEEKVERLRKFLMDEVEALENGITYAPTLIIFPNWLDEEVHIGKQYATDEATALIEKLKPHQLWKGVSYGIDAMVALNIRDNYDESFLYDRHRSAASEFMKRTNLSVKKIQLEKDFLGHVASESSLLTVSDPYTIEYNWKTEGSNSKGKPCTVSEIEKVIGDEENSGSILEDEAFVVRGLTNGKYPVFAYRNDQGDILRIEINMNPYDYEESEWFNHDDERREIDALLDTEQLHHFQLPGRINCKVDSSMGKYAVSNSNVVLGLPNDEDFFVQVGEVFNVIAEVMVHDEMHLVLERLDAEELGMEPFLMERRFCELCDVNEVLAAQESVEKAYEVLVAKHRHSTEVPSVPKNVIPFPTTES